MSLNPFVRRRKFSQLQVHSAFVARRATLYSSIFFTPAAFALVLLAFVRYPACRYPEEAPLILVTNDSMPPGLARRLMEQANAQAAKMVSMA